MGVGTLQVAGSIKVRSRQLLKNKFKKIAQSSSSTGSFWGKVVVNGQQIFYRAFTLPDGTINVGTYTVGAP